MATAEERLLFFMGAIGAPLGIEDADWKAHARKARRLLREVKRECAERAVAAMQRGAISDDAVRAALARPKRRADSGK